MHLILWGGLASFAPCEISYLHQSYCVYWLILSSFLFCTHDSHAHSLTDKLEFDSLLQFCKLCSIRNNNKRRFCIKHLLGIDIHGDFLALLDCNDIKSVFSTQI